MQTVGTQMNQITHVNLSDPNSPVEHSLEPFPNDSDTDRVICYLRLGDISTAHPWKITATRFRVWPTVLDVGVCACVCTCVCACNYVYV